MGTRYACHHPPAQLQQLPTPSVLPLPAGLLLALRSAGLASCLTFSTTTATTGARLVSAECIAEAPSYDGTLALANFGSVAFTHCTADGTPIGATTHPAAVTMYANGAIHAAPSWLTPSGTDFTILWLGH